MMEYVSLAHNAIKTVIVSFVRLEIRSLLVIQITKSVKLVYNVLLHLIVLAVVSAIPHSASVA